MTSQRMAVNDWRAMIDKTEAQSDSEPVAWRYRVKSSSSWFVALKDDASYWCASNYEVEPLYTAPPRPDASAGLIEAAEWHEEQIKKYKKHGGFSMRELELFHNEAATALRARAADRSGK